eukprot:gene32298-39058_t
MSKHYSDTEADEDVHTPMCPRRLRKRFTIVDTDDEDAVDIPDRPCRRRRMDTAEDADAVQLVDSDTEDECESCGDECEGSEGECEGSEDGSGDGCDSDDSDDSGDDCDDCDSDDCSGDECEDEVGFSQDVTSRICNLEPNYDTFYIPLFALIVTPRICMVNPYERDIQ